MFNKSNLILQKFRLLPGTSNYPTIIGSNSKFFISGDIEQTDRYKDKKHSGLYDAITRFGNVPGIGIFEFGEKDGVRNPIITKILQRYEEDRN